MRRLDEIGVHFLDAPHLNESADVVAGCIQQLVTHTDDPKRASFVMELAERYGVDDWDVALSQLLWLLAKDPPPQLSDVKAHVDKLGSRLARKPKLLATKLTEQVFPDIDGRNHAAFVAVLSLLKDAGAPLVDGCKTVGTVHIEAATKLARLQPCVDWRCLVHGGEDAISEAVRVVTSSNVELLAHATSNLRGLVSAEGGLPRGVVYGCLCLRLLDRGGADGAEPPARTPSGHADAAFERLDLCREQFEFMGVADRVWLATRLLHNRVDFRLPPAVCQRVLDDTRAAATNPPGGKKGKGTASKNDITPEEAVADLDALQASLAIVTKLDAIQDFRDHALAPEFNRASCAPADVRGDELRGVLVECVCRATPVALVDQLAQAAADPPIPIEVVYVDALSVMVKRVNEEWGDTDRRLSEGMLGEVGGRFGELREALQEALTASDGRGSAMVRQLDSNLQAEDLGVGCRIALVQLRKFLRADLTSTASPQAERTSGDDGLLLQYRTHSIALRAFPDLGPVTAEMMSTEESRRELFKRLLDATCDETTATALVEIVTVWDSHVDVVPIDDLGLGDDFQPGCVMGDDLETDPSDATLDSMVPSGCWGQVLLSLLDHGAGSAAVALHQHATRYAVSADDELGMYECLGAKVEADHAMTLPDDPQKAAIALQLALLSPRPTHRQAAVTAVVAGAPGGEQCGVVAACLGLLPAFTRSPLFSQLARDIVAHSRSPHPSRPSTFRVLVGGRLASVQVAPGDVVAVGVAQLVQHNAHVAAGLLAFASAGLGNGLTASALLTTDSVVGAAAAVLRQLSGSAEDRGVRRRCRKAIPTVEARMATEP